MSIEVFVKLNTEQDRQYDLILKIKIMEIQRLL